MSAIHCGTNDDINEQTAETYLEKMKAIVDSLQTVNPKIKIILSNITPRGDNEMYDINRQELNVKRLKEYNLNPRITFCDHNNLARNGSTANQFYAVDKINLNENGTKVLASNISTAIKNVLGIKAKNHNFMKRGNRNNRYRRSCKGYRRKYLCCLFVTTYSIQHTFQKFPIGF